MFAQGWANSVAYALDTIMQTLLSSLRDGGVERSQEDMSSREELQRRWQEINTALAGLSNVRPWPVDTDIAEFEGELLMELDEIEYQEECKPLDF